MVIAELKIKCWKWGREEEITEILEDRNVDFNLDKPCPNWFGSWMTKSTVATISGVIFRLSMFVQW